MADHNPRKLIVSLTSFPARITFVPQVLDCLLAQNHPADEIILWLSQDQFPGREKDLPEALCQAASAGKILLRWVQGDLKPHKKYFYAFREYPEDIVVTVDDDVLYPRNLLKSLWDTHLQYPEAVVAGRTHLMTLDPAGQPRPYASWLRRVIGFEEGPSMQLFAVGIGGTLYDPKWFPEELYDEKTIRETCLMADDLWLKTMEMAAGIPVVRSSGEELIRIVPGSQESSLFSTNLKQNQNDVIFTAIRNWADAYYGRDIITEQLQNDRWPRICGEDDLIEYINQDKQRTLLSATSSVARVRRLVTLKEEQISKLENDIADIRSSLSFKLGNAVVSPFSRILKKKHD